MSLIRHHFGRYPLCPSETKQQVVGEGGVWQAQPNGYMFWYALNCIHYDTQVYLKLFLGGTYDI